MVTKILHIMALAGMLCLGCISCSDETAPQQAVPDNSKGQVKILYKIAGSSLSRAETTPEPGWSGDWHENLITRIDLFVFTSEGEYYDHIEASAAEGESLSDTDEDRYTPLETDALTYEDVSESDYIYYMVANCPQLADLQNITLAQLKEKMIGTAIVLDEKQDVFVMDGEGVRTNSEDGQTITLSFDLSRAAVKIRLTVNDKNGKSILNQCKYSFQNYVTDGTSVMQESEAYGEGTGQNRMCMERNADEMFSLTYDIKAVFYSYPNDWFDESLLNNEGIFTDPEIYAKDDLIDEEKQTYILLKAPFTNELGETVESYYKVPVNFTIADNNDKVEFSANDIKTLRDTYYRIKRNYIYDITVTIDHEGGTYLDPEEIANLTIDANPWEREDFKVKYEDNLSYMSEGWDESTILGYLDTEETIVHIDPDQPAVLHFTIQTPSYATWRAQLIGEDQNFFEFVGEHSGDASPASQTISIRCKEPDSDDRHSVTLYVYASIFGQEYELNLTNPQQSLTPNTSGEIRRFTILQAK